MIRVSAGEDIRAGEEVGLDAEGRLAQSRAMTGYSGRIGLAGVVKRDIHPGAEGKVLVHGELWKAVSDKNFQVRDKVRVSAAKDLVLSVDTDDRPA